MEDHRDLPSTVHLQAAGSATGPDDDQGLPGAVLLSKLGHELRSPLTGIAGLTRIMLMKLAEGSVLTAQHIRQLEMVRASAAEMLETVDRIVAVAKLDVATAPAVDTFDCRATIATVVAHAAPSAEARRRRLIVEVPDEPVLATGHEYGLQRLLTELVDNAIKYTDQTDIRIRCRSAAHGSPVIDVSDDGPGMTVDEQTHIYTPFARGAAAAQHDVAGSGLGLYLAQQLAANCGAALTVRSAPSSGTTFAVQLNAPASSAAADTPG